MDEFFEKGMISTIKKEHMRGFELGYKTCLEVFEGVMRAALADKTMIEQSSRLDEIDKQNVPELAKALAVGLHIAKDKSSYVALTKANANPMSEELITGYMKELEQITDVPNPFAALGGDRNKPPQWN